MTFPELVEQFKRWTTIEQEFYGNSPRQWMTALGVFLLAALVFRLLRTVAARHAHRLAERSRIRWDDAIIESLKSTKSWFLLMGSLYCGSLALTVPEKTRGILESITIIIVLLQTGVWVSALLSVALQDYASRQMERDPAAVTTVSALGFLARMALYAVIALLILDNLGIDVTPMIASLGVGGIAVALAAQNILGDLFASMSIVLDKPFVLGDFIIVGDQMGTVEKIGLKTTRLRALSGEQLVFSNNDLLQSRVHNYRRMEERRIVFTMGVTYDTPREKLESIPEMIREIIEALEGVRFDRSHFKSFGSSSLDFETVYYVLVPDYNVFMDRQQSINLSLLDRFAEQGIQFAFPTQTIHVDTFNSEAVPRMT